MSAPLRERHARAGKVPKLARAELEAGLAEIPEWRLAPVAQEASPAAKGVSPVAPAPVLAQSIQRHLKFKDFVELMRFVNRMADMAQAENHHPDFSVHYNQLDITLWTHDAGGLTENDLVVAARIDGLLDGLPAGR